MIAGGSGSSSGGPKLRQAVESRPPGASGLRGCRQSSRASPDFTHCRSARAAQPGGSSASSISMFGNLILDGEPRAASRTDQHIAFPAQGGLAHGANQQRQKLLSVHLQCLLGVTHDPSAQASAAGRIPAVLAADERWHYDLVDPAIEAESPVPRPQNRRSSTPSRAPFRGPDSLKPHLKSRTWFLSLLCPL